MLKEQDVKNRIRAIFPNLLFDKFKYNGMKSKVTMICKYHGEFEIRPYNIIYLNKGCRQCGIKRMKKSKSANNLSFIRRCINIFGDKYDYSLVEYINNKTKVKIICKIHGVFEQMPMNMLNGFGCRKCKKKS